MSDDMSPEEQETAAKAAAEQLGLGPPSGGSQGGLVLEAKSEDSLQLIDMRKQLNAIPDALWIESATNTLGKVCAYLHNGLDDNCTMETGYGNSVPEKPKNMLTRTIMNRLLIPLFNTSIKKEELIRKFTEYDEIEEEVDNPLDDQELDSNGKKCKCEKEEKGEEEEEEEEEEGEEGEEEERDENGNSMKQNKKDNTDITEPLSVAMSLQNAQNNKIVRGGMFGKDYGCNRTPTMIDPFIVPFRKMIENLPPVNAAKKAFKNATGKDLDKTSAYQGHIDHAAGFVKNNFIRFQRLDPNLVTKIITEEQEYLKSFAMCLAEKDFGISKEAIEAKLNKSASTTMMKGGAETNNEQTNEFVLTLVANLHKEPEAMAKEFVPLDKIEEVKQNIDKVKEQVKIIPGAEAVLPPDESSSATPASNPSTTSSDTSVSTSSDSDSSSPPPPPQSSGSSDPSSGVFKSEDGLSNMDAITILNYWEDKVKNCITCNKGCHDKIEELAIKMMEISMKEILINKEDFYKDVFDNHKKFGTKKLNDERIETRLKYIQLLKPALNDPNTVKLYLVLLGELHFYYILRQTYDEETEYGKNYADNEIKTLLNGVSVELINKVKEELGSEHRFSAGFYKILKLEPPDAVGGNKSINFDDFFFDMFGGNMKNRKNVRRTKKRRKMKNNYSR